jgi:hypothetical protein
MQLQQVVIRWTCRTNTLLVIKLVGLEPFHSTSEFALTFVERNVFGT